MVRPKAGVGEESGSDGVEELCGEGRRGNRRGGEAGKRATGLVGRWGLRARGRRGKKGPVVDKSGQTLRQAP